jgi:tRNA (guanine37-N1)-methyltransferase
MDFIALTIFPEMFDSFRKHGIIKRAVERELIALTTLNIRDYASGKHRVTDDRPYGGGCGMVMKPEPLAAAIRDAKSGMPRAKTVLLTPQGSVFDQNMAHELTACSGLIFICGRYEGIDERIYDNYVDIEISIGDYVLTGGELAAMIIIEAVTRLIPGALGGEDSADKDSFSDGLLEHAHYTRPPDFENEQPPSVLLSGNHGAIEKWRLESSLIRTLTKRKDLLEKRSLNRQELEILKKWGADIERIIRAQSASGSGSPSGGK